MNSYTVKTSDTWEAAVYITFGARLAGIEPVLTNGRVGCQLVIEGENLAELQRQYFSGLMETRIFEFRRVLGYLHSAVNKSKKKFQNILKNGSTKLADHSATADTLADNGGAV